MYYQFGGGGGGDDMDEMIAQMMFGGMGGRMPRQRRGRDEGIGYPVTLEDLYVGKTVTIPREKTVVTGQGRNQQIKQVSAPLKVTIEKGMQHEQQIRFKGEGDQHPQIQVPGDVVVVLQEEKHEVFTRDGSDLHIAKKLTLAEALCGFQFVIKHLDGRGLVVRSEPGMIIAPDKKKCIPNEGMPVFQKPGEFGDLIITFEVDFPERVEASAVDLLRGALPPPKSVEYDFDPTEAETVYVTRQNLDDVRREVEREEDDDDEEGPGGMGPGLQCAHQ